MTEARRKYHVWAVSETRRKLKLRAIEYKGGKCLDCGYDRCVAALTFHHLDPDRKDFGLSSMVGSWVRIRKEVDKCVLLCANCHQERHYKESEEIRIQQEIEVRRLIPAKRGIQAV